MFDLLMCVESRIYRDGLTALLIATGGIGRVAACTGAEQIEAMLRAGPCDVVLIDVAMSAGGGDPAKNVTTAYHAADGRPVIALGLENSDEAVLSFVEAGAAAFITKNGSIDDLVSVITTAARGELLCTPRVARLMQERLLLLTVSQRRPAELDKLSRRELHILEFVEQRMSNKQIARTLGLEVSTVKNHMHNIIVKLCVNGRGEAAAMLRCGGITDLPRAAAGR